MPDHTAQQTSPARISSVSAAFRQTCRLSAATANAANLGVTPGRKRIAREAFRIALADLVAHEDKGIETAWVADLLTRDRQRATDLGLLTAADVSRIEREVCSA